MLFLTAGLALSAATLVKSDQVTWGAVVFTYHGEKIPYLDDGPSNLTPLGANQLMSAGATIRDRYISAPSNGSQLTVNLPINGLSVNGIDNSQMAIMSTTDEYVSSSALAFMQGLYPPRSTTTAIVDEESILGNGTLEQFPLSGYQYPNVATLSSLDLNYIWLAGNIGCTNYSAQRLQSLASQDYVSQDIANEDFYGNLSNTVFSGLEPDIISYANAQDLYEYALFQWNHNRTIYEDLSPSDLTKLYTLASEQQWTYNSPSEGSNINAIAGQTFSSKVIQQFALNIASDGVAEKLTLMFGSFEPFLSFFALSGLSEGPAAKRFNTLPEHGSSMVFELFSNPTTDAGQNDSVPFPSIDELFVRFLFRNGTDENSPLIQYPLFGNGNSQVDMSWQDFVFGIGLFSVDLVVDWCTSCEAVNLFCEAIEENVSSLDPNSPASRTSTNHKGMSPAIGGVIGATVTLAVGILVALSMCLFGFRIDYKCDPKSKEGLGVLRRNGSANGGFKGAEKLASDTDLRLKDGAGVSVVRHERVGSWELNEAAKNDGKHSSLDKEIESGREANYRRNSEDSIAHADPFGDPVKPLDQV